MEGNSKTGESFAGAQHPVLRLWILAALCFWLPSSVAALTAGWGGEADARWLRVFFGITPGDPFYTYGVYVPYLGMLPAVISILAAVIALRMALTDPRKASPWRNGIFVASVLALIPFWIYMRTESVWEYGLALYPRWAMYTGWFALVVLAAGFGHLLYVFIFRCGPIRGYAAILGAGAVNLALYTCDSGYIWAYREESPFFICYPVIALAIIIIGVSCLPPYYRRPDHNC